MRSVAEHNAAARIALCENSNWGLLHSLLNFSSYSIDDSLKTDILLTLSVLGKSKETALQLWFNLEASQIITTIPSTSGCDYTVPCVIERQIGKAESHDETQAILELLYTLFSTILPKNLGAGTRKPGINPYFDFVLHSIFLKLYRYAAKFPYFFYHVDNILTDKYL